MKMFLMKSEWFLSLHWPLWRLQKFIKRSEN